MLIIIDKNVEKFIFNLEKPAIAKTLRTIDLLEKFGSGLGAPHSKKIKNKLFELRIRGRQEVRIFYTFRQEKIILLHAVLKKSSKIPKQVLNLTIAKLHQLT